MIQLENLQNELENLPRQERLKLAHWLLDSLVETPPKALPQVEMLDENPLTEWIGLSNLTSQLFGALGHGAWDEYDLQLDWVRFEV